jgi:hypothetical protein
MWQLRRLLTRARVCAVDNFDVPDVRVASLGVRLSCGSTNSGNPASPDSDAFLRSASLVAAASSSRRRALLTPRLVIRRQTGCRLFPVLSDRPDVDPVRAEFARQVRRGSRIDRPHHCFSPRHHDTIRLRPSRHPGLRSGRQAAWPACGRRRVRRRPRRQAFRNTRVSRHRWRRRSGRHQPNIGDNLGHQLDLGRHWAGSASYRGHRW